MCGRHDRVSTLPVLIYHRNECSVKPCTITEDINEETKSRDMVLKPDAHTVFKLKNSSRETTIEPTDELKYHVFSGE